MTFEQLMKYGIKDHSYEKILRHSEPEDGEMQANLNAVQTEYHIMGSIPIRDRSKRA